MSSSDFAVGSRENPAMIDADDDEDPSSNLLDGSHENHAMIIESDSEDEEAPSHDTTRLDALCEVAEMIRKQNEEKEEKWRLDREASDRRYEERQKIQRKEAARDYAYSLHSVKIPQKQSKKQEETEEYDEEEEVKRKGESRLQFHEAKKAIRKRRSSGENNTSSVGIELNLTEQRKAPTLMELTTRLLAKNSDAIESLNLVPDHLRTQISNLASDLGKLDKKFMNLLIEDSPSEVYARNCVDLLEEDLTEILCGCDGSTLKVLNLNLCGRAMTEHTITEFLNRSPSGFPSLTSLTLQGAFCLTDNALELVSISAPLLRFINLSDCSFLSSRAVKILADCFGSTLRGLNIGGCQGMKPSNAVFKRSLREFSGLSYLSVARLESVNDGVIEFLVHRGANLTGLSLASCNDVTDNAIWTIGRYCPKLEALDISELYDLTDKSLEYVTDGCRCLNSVNLTKTRFSDEAVAAFLEVCGGSLDQLCLNNVRDVGQDTAISLAKSCKRLRYLDLSWCRKLTAEELARILNCCSSLESLKLYGWTHVEDEFLEKLSRTKVRISGLKMTSVFAHLDDTYQSIDAKFC
ncbi:unnamed protein product [Microthlaspi erraticum]|uniref:Uncharacterized protein n=1 Tax=Microthlaspi erraticum TaxID=1685480 RepID=A0A6D2L908_9BRAS|nr:unnamed protein product [Microthlaspi erraticum]